jgi:hypothetical protein
MHQWLLDEIARVHDCGGDEKTGDLGSGIEGAEGGADSSEEGGYTLLQYVSQRFLTVIQD